MNLEFLQRRKFFLAVRTLDVAYTFNLGYVAVVVPYVHRSLSAYGTRELAANKSHAFNDATGAEFVPAVKLGEL